MLNTLKQREERKEQEEKAEAAKLRRETAFKAQPIAKFKPLVIESSKMPITVPCSPKFSVMKYENKENIES